MNKDHIPCCAADALRRIRQIPVNGIMTGITMLDETIAATKDLGLTGEQAVSEALMKKIRVYNYVPPAAEEAYTRAVMDEYRKSMREKA